MSVCCLFFHLFCLLARRYGQDPNSEETKIYLQKRRGFVRLAMQHGSELVPVFIFGEKQCYRRLNVPTSVRDWLLRVLKIPLIIFWGRWFTWRGPVTRPLSFHSIHTRHAEREALCLRCNRRVVSHGVSNRRKRCDETEHN